MTAQPEPAPHPDAERNRQAIERFRAQGNDRLLLLTTTGRKSGRALTVPVLFMRDGERTIVAAGNHGLNAPPAWYLNLVANPGVTVEDAQGRHAATAVVVRGAERARLLRMAVKGLPFVAEYQAHTSRRIQLIALERER